MSKKNTQVDTNPEYEPDLQVATLDDPAESAELSTSGSHFTIDPRDINVPRVKVVQKMTVSENDLEIGCLAHEDDYCLMPRDGVLQTAILSAKKGWKQDLPFDCGVMPELFDTEKEAEEWKRGAEPQFNKDPAYLEYAELTLLFKQPSDDDNDDHYPLVYGDDNYAIGKLYVQKDAYKCTFKALMTFASFNPAVDISNVLFDFKTKLLAQDKFSWYVPTLTGTKNKVTPEVAAFSKTFQR